MNGKDERKLQAQRRVLNFGGANSALIPAPDGPPSTWSPITRQYAGLQSSVAQCEQAASEQGVTKSQQTLEGADELALRIFLRDEMRFVTQMCYSLRTEVPGIGAVKMPSPHISVESYLKAADTLTTQASTYESVLVEHGLAADFIAQLRSAIANLRASLDGRGAARANRRGATKQVAESLALGAKYVHMMDVVLSKALRNDPAKLAVWKATKRVTVKGVASSTGASASPFVAPAPAAAAQQPDAKAA